MIFWHTYMSIPETKLRFILFNKISNPLNCWKSAHWGNLLKYCFSQKMKLQKNTKNSVIIKKIFKFQKILKNLFGHSSALNAFMMRMFDNYQCNWDMLCYWDFSRLVRSYFTSATFNLDNRALHVLTDDWRKFCLESEEKAIISCKAFKRRCNVCNLPNEKKSTNHLPLVFKAPS